ncbi:MAG: hypothetical protein EHM61_21000 [Acidobacteria bacterium]|nr:MAG: hypothetical protein EHM61_21000 [Acidobacteriota bacterium]
MKRYILVTLVLLPFIVSLEAQGWRGGNRLCTEPLKSEDLRVIQGTVEELQLEAGKGMPTMVIKGGDGSLVPILVGPYSAWLDKQFSVEKGDQVTVNAFSCLRNTETLAAIEIVNKTQRTQLALRDEYGRPLSRGRGRGPRMGCLGRPAQPAKQ